MGTRNLTCVVLNDEYRVAQYGQWDGYPSGQGVNILEFLKTDFNKDEFIKNLEEWEVLTEEEIKEKYEGESIASLSRDVGSNILYAIQNDTLKDKVLFLSTEFAQDSLFCEWAYVLNLDTDELEVFQGFNTTPLSKSDRFYNSDFKAQETSDGSEYHPVKLLHVFDIQNLPFSKDFVEILEPREAEEEEDDSGLDVVLEEESLEPKKPIKSIDEASKALINLSELAEKDYETVRDLLANKKIPASPELSQLQDVVKKMHKQSQKYLKTIKALGFRSHMLDDEDGFNIAMSAIETG